MADVDIAVVGLGPAGLSAALALARRGRRVALVGPRNDRDDTRTTALLEGTRQAFADLGVWPAIAPHASPLRVMRIIDGTTRLWRAPPVEFESGEIGLEAFGWNVENRVLNAALVEAVRAAGVTWTDRAVANCVAKDREARLRLVDDSEISATLVVAADGRNSPLRQASGIATRQWSYPQVAVTLAFRHGRPHRDVSTEFHTETGPFTLVPLGGERSGLVCVVTRAEADDLMALDDVALADLIERRSRSILGKVTVEPGRSAWPLSGLVADRLDGPRIALVGEAAHAFPPIGAQGFNLTMRDVVALADLTGTAEDPGEAGLLGRYERSRRADIAARVNAVDLLNRSLLSDLLPVQALRGLGLFALDRIGPLRRVVMRQGLAGGLGR